MSKSLLIIVFFFSSCNSIIKLVRGAHKPRIENEKSITNWLKKKNNPYTVVSVAPESYDEFVPGYLGTPLLFTSIGRFLAVGVGNGKYCTQPIDTYVGRLKPINQMARVPDSFFVFISYHFPKGTVLPEKRMSREERNEFIKMAIKKIDTVHLNYDSLSVSFRTLTGDKYEINRGVEYDYILLMPFAKFIGARSNENNLKAYFNAVRSNNRCRIKVILINLDKQEWWGKEWQNKIRINI